MSWDSYVNDHMVTTGMVSGATIAGADGTVWAENWGGTKYAGTDMKEAIVALWNGFGQPMPSGIKIGGDKFMYIRGDEDSMYFKKGAAGLYVMKGATFIALGFHDDSIQPPQCGTVAKICEYLYLYLPKYGCEKQSVAHFLLRGPSAEREEPAPHVLLLRWWVVEAR